MGEAEYQEAAPIPGIERNTHNVFRYRALERSTTFRVLHLHPGREAEPLRGELGHFDLDSPDPLSYEALSYVWGKPKYERCLTTTDGIILLTPNLEVALKRLRRPDQTRYVWADGVCINQSDIQERGHQVKLMKSIYSASKRVIVWLGPDPKVYAKDAFAYISEAFRFGATAWKISDSVAETAIRLLLELFGCEWFERLWVVQEVVLAQEAIALWGNEQIDFRELSYTALEYSRHISQSRTSWVVRLFPCFSIAPVHLHLNFLDVLKWTRNLKCSDPRDKVFAILGLPYPSGSDLNHIVDEIEPDYDKTAADVYLELASAFVRHGALSEILNAVHHGPIVDDSPEALPSWVPSWNNSPAVDFYLDMPSMRISRSVPPSIGHAADSLVVHGVRFSTVTSTSHGNLVDLDCLAQFWMQNVQPLTPPHPNMLFCEAVMDDRAKLYTGDSSQRASYYSQRAAASFLAEYAFMHPPDGIKDPSPEETMLQSIARSLELCSERNWVEEISRHTMRRPERIWRGRKLFLTSGNYIGLGPEAMQDGDIVVIFNRAKVPSILRPKADFYQFVGTANIPGILNGGVSYDIRDDCVEVFGIR